jgi:twitching motility protein PilT
MSEPRLTDLSFTDLYIRLDQKENALYLPRQRGISRPNLEVPPEYAPIINRLVDDVLARKNPDGSMDFEGMRCRLSKQHLADGSHWACIRRINTEVPELEKLGLQPQLLNHMRTLGMRDGLVIISGATGQGKTTTATALMVDFLRKYGGTAVTIEDPAEYVIKGRHGANGYCFQVEVDSEEGWAISLKRALRWAPRYIFVGEIRTPKAAEQLLRAASTGHLVITTVHAGAPEEALMGIIHLAEQAMGPGVENVLASSLTAVIYQTMREMGPYIRYLFTEENAPGDPIRSLIREKKIGMISTYIDKIAARLANAPPTIAAVGQR